MYYHPHKIQKRIEKVVKNEYGDIIETTTQWIDLASGRCDDADNKTLHGADGIAFNPLFKIVTTKVDVQKGDRLRALFGDRVRGEGTVDRVVVNNYLEYITVFLV